jgi:NitT/TauT family transport system permease protein
MKVIKKYFTKHRPPTRREKKAQGPFCNFCYIIAGLLAFFLFWALCGTIIFSRPDFEQFSGFLPKPTLDALIILFFDPDFWTSVAASIRRVTFGVGIALVLGLPIGLFIGYSRRVQVMTYTPIQFIRMISPLSWMPIALLVFNTFETTIYFLLTMATIWPIILNTSLGVKRVNPQWQKMAVNQGANHRQIILHIVLPASIPYILTSLRLAIGVAWIVLVPVEFLGISSGLGYIINDARDTMEYDRLMAIVLAIGIIGFVLDGVVQLLQKVFHWTWVN